MNGIIVFSYPINLAKAPTGIELKTIIKSFLNFDAEELTINNSKIEDNEILDAKDIGNNVTIHCQIKNGNQNDSHKVSEQELALQRLESDIIGFSNALLQVLQLQELMKGQAIPFDDIIQTVGTQKTKIKSLEEEKLKLLNIITESKKTLEEQEAKSTEIMNDLLSQIEENKNTTTTKIQARTASDNYNTLDEKNQLLLEELSDFKKRYAQLLQERHSLLSSNLQKSNLFPTVEKLVNEYHNLVSTKKLMLQKTEDSLKDNLIIFKFFELAQQEAKKRREEITKQFYSALVVNEEILKNSATVLNNFLISYLQANYNNKDIYNIDEVTNDIIKYLIPSNSNTKILEYVKSCVLLIWEFNLFSPPFDVDTTTSTLNFDENLHELGKGDINSPKFVYEYPLLRQDGVVRHKARVKGVSL